MQRPLCNRGVPESQVRVHALCDSCSKRNFECFQYQYQQTIEDTNPVRCAHCGKECEKPWKDKAGEWVCIDCCEDMMEQELELALGKYEQLGKDLGAMTDKKQAAYGDSFGKSGKIMRILYPDGIAPDQYDDALAVVRIIDKLFRIATQKDAFGESPYKDLVGYGLLGAGRNQSQTT